MVHWPLHPPPQPPFPPYLPGQSLGKSEHISVGFIRAFNEMALCYPVAGTLQFFQRRGLSYLYVHIY